MSMAVKHRFLSSLFSYLLATVLTGFFGAGSNLLFAQSELDRDPGYVDFDVMDERLFFAKPEVQVNIRGQLLKLVAEASREEDPEFADLLLRLRAIQIRSFPMRATQIRGMELHSKAIGEELEADGWETVVRLRDNGQHVDVYAIENADYILGLMMMVVDSEVNETILINIVGDMAAEELGRIGSKFDIEPLSEIMDSQ